MKPQLSIIIPTYNRAALLNRVLASFWRQNCGSLYEVLVSVDDDKEHIPETLDVINQYQAKGMDLKYFLTGQYKRGPGWCVETYPYNVGIRQASADLLMLNSGDVLSVTDTIAQHISFHGQQSDPNAILFSTVHSLKYEVMQQIDAYDWVSNPASLLFKGSCSSMYCGHGVSYSDMHQYEEAHQPYHFQMSVNKAVLFALHGFDEDFYGTMPGGDDDLATRMKKYGCAFHFSGDILGIHQWHPNGAAQSTYGFSPTNACMDGLTHKTNFYQLDRVNRPIIRNVSHEWGQYPRDMEHLPAMSGYADHV